jgi:hypothetical protein
MLSAHGQYPWPPINARDAIYKQYQKSTAARKFCLIAEPGLCDVPCNTSVTLTLAQKTRWQFDKRLLINCVISAHATNPDSEQDKVTAPIDLLILFRKCIGFDRHKFRVKRQFVIRRTSATGA